MATMDTMTEEDREIPVLVASDAETKQFKTGTLIKLFKCPSEFQDHFYAARKAIEDGNLAKLRTAVAAMKGNDYEGVPSDQCLNVCDMVNADMGQYAMTLLAYAGYHVRWKMLPFLLAQGADIDMGTKKSGSPLIQIMVHAEDRKTKDKLRRPKLNVSIVQFFVDHGTQLNRVLVATAGYNNSTALELAIFFQRMDIVRVLIKAGADPILCGDGVYAPLIVEYTLFGTNKFLHWLLNEHLAPTNIPLFVKRIMDTGVLTRKKMKNATLSLYGRNGVHALLLCGHQKAVRCLLDNDWELLNERDHFEKTALHLAAEEGDIESVRILLECDAPVDVKDKEGMTPYMLATTNERMEVLTMIENPTDRTKNPMGQWAWAIKNGYATYFEELHKTEELEDTLMTELDSDENTIAHIAAAGGHISVFKATFPKTFKEPIFEILLKENKKKRTPLQLAIENGNAGILTALQERKREREKAASRGRDMFMKQQVSFAARAWQEFWTDHSPKLLLYACQHGTVDTVRYFITRLDSSSTKRYELGEYMTPMAAAARSGKHEIVAFFLSEPGVTAEGVGSDEPLTINEKCYSPLMMASTYGHTKSVKYLLDKGADVTVVSKRGYNCLMEAVENGHKSVVVALLSDKTTWKKSMRHRVKVGERYLTPMRMLIELMPSMSKMVLTKCIAHRPSKNPNHVIYDYEFLEDYYEHIEPATITTTASANRAAASGQGQGQLQLQSTTAFQSSQVSGKMLTQPVTSSTSSSESANLLPGDQSQQETEEEEREKKTPILNPEHYSADDHPVSLMVKVERLDLLQHPLVNRYIFYKWWRLSFPLYMIYLVSYVLFLILLTSFALALPRPSPDNNHCPSENSSDWFTKLNFRGGECQGPNSIDQQAYTVLAVILILFSIFFAIFHTFTLYVSLTRWSWNVTTLTESLVQLVLYSLAIVFVFGFVNDCWCAPPWQWQIGALVICMAYFNLILNLKGMPIIGVPVNMLLNIILVFLKLVYLPILLILAFAFSFYMLFVRQADSGVITAFITPGRSLAKVIMQTTGELDYGALFDEGSLLYTPMAYILFIVFVIVMPILFSNLLVGLAVGTAEEDTQKAAVTNIRLQVDFITRLEAYKPFRKLSRLSELKFAPKPTRSKFLAWWDKKRGVDYDSQVEIVDELNETLEDSTVDSTEAVEEVEEKVKEVASMLESFQLSISQEMASMLESLQLSVSLLDRRHRNLQHTVHELKDALTEKKSTDETWKKMEMGMSAMQEQMNQLLEKISQ